MTPGLWDAHTTDYKSSTWMKDVCEIPFLEAEFRRFGEDQGGAEWRAIDVGCGMGKYTTRLLQAGASYVLALDVSKDMVEGARKETDKILNTLALPGKVNFVVASATDLSSISGAQEGTFDLAICIFVFCTLVSEVEVRQSLAEIFKMLKPGGKLVFYESHVLDYTRWGNSNSSALISLAPKEDGTAWNYFEDEGKPREMKMMMNSGRDIKFTNRLYTLSSWVSWIVEAGFQITQLLEPHVDPKVIPADAPDYVKTSVLGIPMGMCWECTKPGAHNIR